MVTNSRKSMSLSWAWAGPAAILAKELLESGLKVVALERGANRPPTRTMRCRSCVTNCVLSCATT